jgi:hypothetical protein
VGFLFQFHDSFFTGTVPLSTEVPWKWDLALAGRGYLIDTAEDGGFVGPASVPVARTQADTSNEPGEQSLNRDELWRRAMSTWHLGAGQEWQDAPDSVAQRFYASRGIDPWTRNQFSLLPATTKTLSSANGNLSFAVASDFVYVLDGAAVRSSADGAAWSAATGHGAGVKTAIASDGQYVYVADGTSIYRATPGDVFTSWSTGDATLMGYVKGRLMVANGAALYNYTDDTGTVPAALYTHPRSTWVWVGFAEGAGQIYAPGYAGSTLAHLPHRRPAGRDRPRVPIVAAELPGRRSRHRDLGPTSALSVGTTRASDWRGRDGDGNLLLGAVITAPGAVRRRWADRFMWFSWSNYDASRTGLGRLDLSQFGDASAFVPAYASDLMAEGTQGSVVGVATFAGRRLFSVNGIGVFQEDATNYVADGTLETGWVAYNLPDDKVAETIDVRTDPLVGSVAVDLSSGGAYVSTGLTATPNVTGFQAHASEARAERSRIRVTLTRGTNAATAPVVHRITLMAVPSRRARCAGGCRSSSPTRSWRATAPRNASTPRTRSTCSPPT